MPRLCHHGYSPNPSQAKNIFIRKRLTEIIQMLNRVRSQFGVELVFKYVPSAKNSADLMSLKCVLKKISRIWNFCNLGQLGFAMTKCHAPLRNCIV